MRIKIWIPGAIDVSRAVRIEYTVRNALRFFDPDDSNFEAGHDELYWNVTGDEWEVPIQVASARVRLPPEASDVEARVFTGPVGSTARNATATEIELSFYFDTTQPLGSREGMTLSLAWAPGVIARPTAAEKINLFFRANWIFLIPILSFVVMYQLWRTRGRDPSRMAISPQYEPPEDLTPAEIGTLIDNSPDLRDITASIVDLAVRGYLKIEERESTGLVAWLSGSTYSFELVKDQDEWTELQPDESRLMGALFEGGFRKVVQLDDLENEFYKHLGPIKDEIFQRLLRLGYYHHRLDKIVQGYVGAGLATTVFLILGLGFFGNSVDAFYLPLGLGALAALLTARPCRSSDSASSCPHARYVGRESSSTCWGSRTFSIVSNPTAFAA
jgi:hypothetical protein